jgi:hypothetical protein
MAKTMLAISLLVGAGACSGAPTAVRSTPTTGAAPTDHHRGTDHDGSRADHDDLGGA